MSSYKRNCGPFRHAFRLLVAVRACQTTSQQNKRHNGKQIWKKNQIHNPKKLAKLIEKKIISVKIRLEVVNQDNMKPKHLQSG